MIYLSDNWETFTHNGKTYAARLERDETHSAPWIEECEHGPITGWERRDKAPGELVLVEDRGLACFYDFQEACRIARREGWNAKPYDVPGETKRQRAAKAARADYERMRQWCDDIWFYVGVIVAPVCPCCSEIDESESRSLWGIESDAGDYLQEVARELADEIGSEKAQAA